MRRTQSLAGLASLQPARGGNPDSHSATAPRACRVCTRGKRKCDKLLPKCHRCRRLDLPCGYDPLPTTPSPSAEDEIQDSRATPRISQDLELSDLSSVFRSRQVDWRRSINQYFSTVHVWFCIIDQTTFEAALGNALDNGADTEQLYETLVSASKPPEIAVLVLCMYLLTQSADTLNTEDVFGPVYEVAKRTLAIRASLSDPSAEMTQCAALLALFDFGHGRSTHAYRGLSQAAALARLIGMKPGKDGTSEACIPLGQRASLGNVWWGLFILDQYVHLDVKIRDLPLIMETPHANDLLPTRCAYWGLRDPSMGKALAADTPLVTNLATFQRSAQASILLNRAHRWSREMIASCRLPSVKAVATLDQSIRDLLNAMMNQDERWEAFCDSFAMCLCSMFIVFRPYLEDLNSSQRQMAEEPVGENIEKATVNTDFAIQFVTDLSLSFNDHLEKHPSWLTSLAPPAIMSCVLAFEAIAVMASKFEKKYKDISSINASLKTFSKRWSVGLQHLRSE